MIRVETKRLGDKNLGSTEIQIQGDPEILYNDMIMLPQHFRSDEGLKRIFIDASAKLYQAELIFYIGRT